MKIIMLLILFTSCGKIKVQGDVKPVNFGPDFKGAALFCDERYPDDREEAELCFRDYRDYLKLKVELDLNSVVQFCQSRYNNSLTQDDCIDDLIDILNKSLE